MHDRSMQFNLTPILAALAGCLGVALVALNFFVDGGEFGDAGLMFVCFSCVLWVRGWFCRMSQREQNAYELGRDSVRSIR